MQGSPQSSGGPTVASGNNMGGPQTIPGSTTSNFSPVTGNQYTNPGGVLGGNNSVANQLLNPVSQLGGMLNMTQNTYQAQTPNITTQNLNGSIGNAYNQQQQVYGQQQSLANQLLAQSQGQGPNPALAQLNQTTGQNVANQGALMASQRGGNANPALLARQAAMQGAGIQQQAAGQAATLNAQQQLGAEQALQQQQATMGNQALQGQNIFQGAQASQNNAINQGVLGAEGINANVSAQNASTTGGMVGGLLGGAGSVVSSLLNKGGVVKHYDEGGDVAGGSLPADISYGGSNQGSLTPSYYKPPASGGSGGGGAGLIGGLLALLAKGGDVPFSPGLLAGGDVPGKAQVAGDSEKNDTVPTLLSPGEAVIPRSIMESKNPAGKAAEFIKHLKKKKGGYQDVATAKKMCGGGYR